MIGQVFKILSFVYYVKDGESGRTFECRGRGKIKRDGEILVGDYVEYTVSASGVYSTIVPPAGALVTSLPDDYEIIVMDGIEYYMVDNTVFRTIVFEGEPYLEVLGQMYGSLYSRYNVYR